MRAWPCTESTEHTNVFDANTEIETNVKCAAKQGRVAEILADSNDQEPVAATAPETPSTEAVTTENNAEHEESHEKLSDLD